VAADETPAPPPGLSAAPPVTDTPPPSEPPPPAPVEDASRPTEEALLPLTVPDRAAEDALAAPDQSADAFADDAQHATAPPAEAENRAVSPPAEEAAGAGEAPVEEVADDLPAPPDTDAPPAEAMEEAPPSAHDFTFVAAPAARASRRGEWWLLGITVTLAALIVSVILIWYFSFRPGPRADTPTAVAQAYLNALTSGNTVEQAQFATADSKSRRLPGSWLTVNTAALTGDAATQGDAATAPLTLTLIITLPGADPAVPPMPVTATCALTLPLVRESAAWRVDQTIFFRQLRDALAAQLPGTALPAWDF